MISTIHLEYTADMTHMKVTGIDNETVFKHTFYDPVNKVKTNIVFDGTVALCEKVSDYESDMTKCENTSTTCVKKFTQESVLTRSDMSTFITWVREYNIQHEYLYDHGLVSGLRFTYKYAESGESSTLVSGKWDKQYGVELYEFTDPTKTYKTLSLYNRVDEYTGGLYGRPVLNIFINGELIGYLKHIDTGSVFINNYDTSSDTYALDGIRLFYISRNLHFTIENGKLIVYSSAYSGYNKITTMYEFDNITSVAFAVTGLYEQKTRLPQDRISFNWSVSEDVFIP